MTFTENAITDVVLDVSGETPSIGGAAAEDLKNALMEAQGADIQPVSGATITSNGVIKAAQKCINQAKGIANVEVIQLPTGDENDWLGTEPTIDEASITDTWDTDILIVGAGNGGMCAAAYAAKNGLNFRIIEQNGAVMETRGWYGAIDSSEAQKQGVAPVDRAELLSEISRTMGGRCDQRVVKTWIDESAAMHDFVASIMESDPYNYTCNLTSGDEAKWPDDTQVSQTKLMFPVQQIDYSTAEKPRNEVFQEYIEGLGYSIDFNTALAKLEKDDTGRITGVIAQSNDDGHFIRINASKGVLLACGGYPGNPYMMEQLDPLGTSVTTACSYAPADKGYGIRAAVWAGANLDKEAAPMLFDRGIIAPGQDAGYVESSSAFGGKAFPGTIKQYNPGTQPFLKVNRHGERFANESCPYDFLNYAASLQTDGVYAAIMDCKVEENVIAYDQYGCAQIAVDMAKGGALMPALEQQVEAGLAFKADTIEELAEKLGLPVETFAATVARYNELAAKGVDEDFGKEGYRLSALAAAPYYGVRQSGGYLICTMDGIQIDDNMHALDTESKPIPGLYVIGDMSGNYFSHSYPSLLSGAAAGRSATFGRLAGQNAAAGI